MLQEPLPRLHTTESATTLVTATGKWAFKRARTHCCGQIEVISRCEEKHAGDDADNSRNRGKKEYTTMKHGKPKACTVCGSEKVSRDPFFYYWQRRRFWIMRCSSCSHQFVHPPVSAEDQAAIYSDRYFLDDGDWVCGCWEADYFSAEPQLRSEAREVLDMLPLSSGYLLDIGCAGGVFLDEARRRGFQVKGVELNASMANQARTKFGIDVIQSRIEDIDGQVSAAEFDVITLLDCLEHVPLPNSVLQKAARWLKSDGFVFIRGPLSNSRLVHLKEGIRRSFRLTKQLPGYPLDANTFNKKSLAALLSTTGFAVETWLNETRDFANLLGRKKM